MTRKPEAERLRLHLHDLSSDVARRLIAVLDSARDNGQELGHDFNDMVCEITAIQRELVQELTAPQAAKSTSMVTMGRLLELHDRAVNLLEHVESLLGQSAFDHLPRMHSARHTARTAWDDVGPSLSRATRMAAPSPGRASQSTARRAHLLPEEEDSRAYVPFVVRTTPATPDLRHGTRATMGLLAAGGTLRPRMVEVPTWLVFGAALAGAFLLSATLGAQLVPDDAGTEMARSEAGRALRGDKLAQDSGPIIVRPSPSAGELRTQTLADADPPEISAPSPRAAVVTETGALPPAVVEGRPSRPIFGRGFQAVLGTYDDEDAARSAFARVKSSQPSLLGDASPQIEAVEGQAGKRWARLSVPVMARDDAAALCQQLSGAGHTGCWVKPEISEKDRVYGAVVATRSDPAAAREAFFQLKARFPAALGGAQPQVEAVRMQDGSTWHRVSAAPGGSREEAKAVCRRLRKLGHFACWVKPAG